MPWSPLYYTSPTCGMDATYCLELGLYTDRAESCGPYQRGPAHACLVQGTGHLPTHIVGVTTLFCPGQPCPNCTGCITNASITTHTLHPQRQSKPVPTIAGCIRPPTLSSCMVSSAMRPLLGRPMRSVLRGAGLGSLVTAPCCMCAEGSLPAAPSSAAPVQQEHDTSTAEPLIGAPGAESHLLARRPRA
jgi:hypothetical protein